MRKAMKVQMYIIIATTFILAFMLELLPLPEWTELFRPAWLEAVLLYWLFALPHRVGIGWAFGLGLLLDVANGTLLGMHALGLTCIAYIALTIHQRVRMYPVWQQAGIVLVLLFLYQGLLNVLAVVLLTPVKTWSFGWQTLSTMLLWPWIFVVLRDCRRRFKINE